MLIQLESLTERLGGSNELVDHWFHVRKQLLVAYYNLVGIKPGKESFVRLNEKALDDFCQNLVDYLSAGHFNIYERIISGKGAAHFPPQQNSIHSWKPILCKSWSIMIPAWKMPSITTTLLSFSRRCPALAKRWPRALRWKMS